MPAVRNIEGGGEMKGILFSKELIPLVLSGQKTQTRRLIKPQPENNVAYCPYSSTGFAGRDKNFACKCSSEEFKPRYLSGETVYVKETWGSVVVGWERFGPVKYKADHPGKKTIPETNGCSWRSPLTMPEWASRCKLLIKDVRVERLQEITEGDCLSEGVRDTLENDTFTPARYNFILLWNRINLEQDWESNPWVWVYTFEVTK
jgi:hypothetical protein